MNAPDILFMCPKCDGPHFNISNGGTLVCASVSKLTDFKVIHGGCGWKGTLLEKTPAATMKETITWITDGSLPNSDITLLVCTREGEVDAGFYSGDCWRWVGTDQHIKDHEVKAWAPLPKGPL